MNGMQSDHLLWKIIFGFMMLVAGLVFVGALALGDADIFNRDRAQAEAMRINSQTAYDSQRGQIDLSVYPLLAWERGQAQIRLIRAQADQEAAAVAESVRVMRADNDRMLAARAHFDTAKIWFALLAAVGLLVVVLYGLVLFVQRTLDRLLPPRRKVVVMATAPAHTAADPWDNPAFQAWMRQQARQREAAMRAAELAERRPVTELTPVSRPLTGNGTHGNGTHGSGTHGSAPIGQVRVPQPKA